MLNQKFCNTTHVDSAFYVHIKTEAQPKAFEAICSYEGMCAKIDAIGYWYYDECIDKYKPYITRGLKNKDLKKKII
jgi:hypothetical protein